MDLYNYRRMMLRQGKTEGEVRKRQSDVIMDATWDRDIQQRRCYLYDYYHDDERDKSEGMVYGWETTKTPVDCKFIITQYGSLAKDQVEYHIQFRPSYNFENLPYFEKYRKKYQSAPPIGMFLDIPDDEGVYRKWLICSKEIGNQFVKYSVLPCNYFFHWVTDGKRYEMWGVARLRSSYNSGLWQNNIFTEVENQDQIWLPMNEITNLLYYDQRFIICTQSMETPITWTVSKVENIHPFGIQKLTLSQAKFDPRTDKKVDGWWYADYAPVGVEPTPEPSRPVPGLTISYVGTNPNIKIGGAPKKYIADFRLGTIRWEFEVDGKNAGPLLHITYDAEGCLVSTGDESLAGKVMTIRVIQEDGRMAELQVGFSYL